MAGAFDLAIVAAHGLSSLAVHQNAAGLVAALFKRLRADPVFARAVTPVAVVEQGRVAVGAAARPAAGCTMPA